MERTQHQKEVRQFYGVVILIGVSIGAILISIGIGNWYDDYTKYDIEQHVTVAEGADLLIATQDWERDNPNKSFRDCPYVAEKKFYVLYTTMHNESRIDLGTPVEVQNLKCKRYAEMANKRDSIIKADLVAEATRLKQIATDEAILESLNEKTCN